MAQAPSYHNAKVLERTVRGYIDKVAAFKGANWSQTRILPEQIQARVLDLMIPGAGTATQQQVLRNLVKYGTSVQVRVNLIVYP